MTTASIVKQLKESDTDYEFYPTTIQMIEAFADYIKNNSDYNRLNRMLDVGCGNGNVFIKLDKVIEKYDRSDVCFSERFGIEKSQILINELPNNVTLLGTEFFEQSLIDKQMDVIFCNPPYSQYEEWVEKIILEGNAKIIAFVIPVRWTTSDRIKVALSRRGFKTEIIGEYDFLEADRKARAKVNLVILNSIKNYSVKDPFDTWFDDLFKDIKKEEVEEKENKEEIIEQEIIKSENVVTQLVNFYNADMEKVYSNYKAIESLDAGILKELNVDISALKKGLKVRIAGLKNIYWNMLFKRYDKITSRLTSFSRKKILDKLYANAVVDFTEKNIFAVTNWIIRNSNTMFDEQLKDFYLKLSNPDSIKQYKSDKRFSDDDWRYLKQSVNRYGYWNDTANLKNYILDYRIVYKGSSNFDYSGLSEETFNLISDMIIIAKNLGFSFKEDIFPSNHWNTEKFACETLTFCYSDGSDFVNIRLYQNGNKHLKFDINFMKKLNIEASRLNGWIKSKEEAVQELDIDEEDITKFWNCNKQLAISNAQLLLLE